MKIFAQLHITTQVRGWDIKDLFNHKPEENHLPFPAKSGEGGVKDYLLSCIKAKVLPLQTETMTEAVAVEVSVMVNIAKPGNKKTFYGYAIIWSFSSSSQY